MYGCGCIHIYTPCEPRSYGEPNDYAIVSTTASVMTADVVRLDCRRIEGLLDKKRKKKKNKKEEKKEKERRREEEGEAKGRGVIDRERSSLVLRCPYLI